MASRRLVYIVCFLSASALACTSVRYARSAEGRIVTRDMVLTVALSMSEVEVRAVLGAPEEMDRALFSGGRTLKYGKGPALSYGAYTVLWVHLDDTNRVREVYSKLYASWSPDDEPRAFGRGENGAWEGHVFTKAFSQ